MTCILHVNQRKSHLFSLENSFILLYDSKLYHFLLVERDFGPVQCITRKPALLAKLTALVFSILYWMCLELGSWSILEFMLVGLDRYLVTTSNETSFVKNTLFYYFYSNTLCVCENTRRLL